MTQSTDPQAILQEIQSNINELRRLYEPLLSSVKNLKKNSDRPAGECLNDYLSGSLPPLQAAQTHVALAYSIYSAHFMALKLRGEDTSSAALADQLDRIKLYMKKVNLALKHKENKDNREKEENEQPAQNNSVNAMQLEKVEETADRNHNHQSMKRSSQSMEVHNNSAHEHGSSKSDKKKTKKKHK
jgi:hypothetical protein